MVYRGSNTTCYYLFVWYIASVHHPYLPNLCIWCWSYFIHRLRTNLSLPVPHSTTTRSNCLVVAAATTTFTTSKVMWPSFHSDFQPNTWYSLLLVHFWVPTHSSANLVFPHRTPCDCFKPVPHRIGALDSWFLTLAWWHDHRMRMKTFVILLLLLIRSPISIYLYWSNTNQSAEKENMINLIPQTERIEDVYWGYDRPWIIEIWSAVKSGTSAGRSF